MDGMGMDRWINMIWNIPGIRVWEYVLVSTKSDTYLQQ